MVIKQDSGDRHSFKTEIHGKKYKNITCKLYKVSYFGSINHTKKSIALDFQNKYAIQAIKDLAM